MTPHALWLLQLVGVVLWGCSVPYSFDRTKEPSNFHTRYIHRHYYMAFTYICIISRRQTCARYSEKLKVVKAAEAEADAVYIKILGGSLNKNYLEWKRIERDNILYERVGEGDKVIVSNTNVTPMINTK